MNTIESKVEPAKAAVEKPAEQSMPHGMHIGEMQDAAAGNMPKDDHAHNADILEQDPKHPHYLNSPKSEPKVGNPEPHGDGMKGGPKE